MENAVLGKILSSQDFYLRLKRNMWRIFESNQSTHCLFSSQPLSPWRQELVPKQDPGVFNEWAACLVVQRACSLPRACQPHLLLVPEPVSFALAHSTPCICLPQQLGASVELI